jgi:exopolysaccharide biosynthesis WecB/TagA/CpsF family protein
MSKLEELLKSGGTITWVNHFSVQLVMRLQIDLNEFDLVGIDGFFLRRLLKLKLGHSSADSDLPKLLNSAQLKVGLIGGTPDSAKTHEVAFTEKFPGCDVLWSIDGYGNSESIQGTKLILDQAPDLILIGMGAGKQEMEALRIRGLYQFAQARTLICTCGGWLDQLEQSEYYPSWAIRLNLRWAIRMFREPRRLLSRYTFWAVSALVKSDSIRSYLLASKHFTTQKVEI